MRRIEIEIDPKIDLVGTGSENDITVAAMLQLLQHQSNDITIKSCKFRYLNKFRQIAKTIKNQN